MRNLSAESPSNASQVHLTSCAVNSLPSCHLTPLRSGKVSCVPSSLHHHPVARSGTIEGILFFATCFSKSTRLLNTPIVGITAVIVDSSWIDMLAGLAKSGICRMPPGFCAKPGTARSKATSNAPVAAGARRFRAICVSAVRGLFVQPDVLVAPAVVDAIDHDGQPFHPGLPTGSAARVEDDRTSAVLGQPHFDFPYQLFAFVLIGLRRLAVDQLVDLQAALGGIVPLRTTDIIFVELLIRIVDTGFRDTEPDCKVLAHHLGIPLDGVDRFELRVDIDLA